MTQVNVPIELTFTLGPGGDSTPAVAIRAQLGLAFENGEWVVTGQGCTGRGVTQGAAFLGWLGRRVGYVEDANEAIRERERVRQTVLDTLRTAPATFDQLMMELGPSYRLRGSNSREGRRLDVALQHHRRAGKIRYEHAGRRWYLTSS